MTLDELRAEMRRRRFNGPTLVHWKDGEPAVVQFMADGQIRLERVAPVTQRLDNEERQGAN
ncbi:MAG: hypothetical protein ACRDGM_03165 [bacterium]